jgi:hypothetical protein
VTEGRVQKEFGQESEAEGFGLGEQNPKGVLEEVTAPWTPKSFAKEGLKQGDDVVNQKGLLGGLRWKEDVERDGKGGIKRSEEAKVVGPEAGESFQDFLHKVSVGVKDGDPVTEPDEGEGDVEKDSGFPRPRLTDEVEMAGELGRGCGQGGGFPEGAGEAERDFLFHR